MCVCLSSDFLLKNWIIKVIYSVWTSLVTTRKDLRKKKVFEGIGGGTRQKGFAGPRFREKATLEG